MTTTFGEFREDMLCALYQEQMHNGVDDYISFHELAGDYDIDWRKGWLLDLQKSLIDEGFLRGPRNSQNDEMAIGNLIGNGLRYIEDKYGTLDGVPTLIAKRGEPLVTRDAKQNPPFDPEIFDPEIFDTGSEIRTPTGTEIPSFSSANWTGIDNRLTPEAKAHLSELAASLVGAIDQSELDDRSKLTARKHVEAVQTLLDAPEPPWKAIVELLNHPGVTAFLVAIQILQLIWAAAS